MLPLERYKEKMPSPFPSLFDEISTFLKYLGVVLILPLTSNFHMESHSNILITGSLGRDSPDLSHGVRWPRPMWDGGVWVAVVSPTSRCRPALRSLVARRRGAGKSGALLLWLFPFAWGLEGARRGSLAVNIRVENLGGVWKSF